MDQFIFKIEDKDDNSTYRLAYCPDGWREYGVSFGREDNVSNVVKSYSGSWSFAKEDGDYIWTKFAKYGPNRRLKLVILSLENGLTETYSTCYVGYLDLTQIERDNNVVSVPVNEGGFFKALENKWSEDYSYPYDRFLRVNGNVFSEEARLTSPDSTSGQIMMGQNSKYGYVITGGQIANRDNISDVFFQDTNIQHLTEYYAGAVWNDPTLLSVGNATITTKNKTMRNLSVDYYMDLRYYIDGLQIDYQCEKLESYISLYLVTCPIDEPVYVGRDNPKMIWTKIGGVTTTSDVRDNTVGGKNNVVINPILSGSVSIDDFLCSDTDANDYAVFLIVEVEYGRQIAGNSQARFNPARNFPGGNYNVRFNMFDVTIKYEQRINTGKLASVIPSVEVFKNLIRSINNSRYNVTVDTSEFEAVASDDILTSRSGLRRMITMEGSRRRIAISGRITTNLSAFLSYCYAVYGFKLVVDYDMESDKYRVFLSHAGNMYSNSETVRLERINDVRLSVWRDVLYSSVVLGYEKDENAINGDRDFNCKYTLSTPNTEIERNEMQMVSPYSASSRSFETELYKEYRSAYEEGGEDGSIYLLSGHYVETSNVSGNEIWELSRDIDVTRGSLFPNDEYNVKFSPQRMMLRHAVELNGFFAFEEGKRLFVETCDGNANIAAGGISETHYDYDNTSRASYESEKMRRIMYVIGSERVFRPVLISVSSIGDSSIIGMISSKRLGYVSFSHGGHTFKGYLSHNTNAVTIHPMDEKECEFNLLITEDSYFPQ